MKWKRDSCDLKLNHGFRDIGLSPLRKVGLRYNKRSNAVGAQTKRPGEAPAGEAMLGGKRLTGHLSLISEIRGQIQGSS